MKLADFDSRQYVFELSHRERELLEGTLKLYPVSLNGFHPISRTGNPDDLTEAQQMLEEAMAESRQENRATIRNFIRDPARFKKKEDQLHLHLPASQMDWLLSVLNEVRVGSWERLGCPDEPPDDVSAENIRWAIAMDVCAVLQSVLLDALDQNESNP